MVLLLAFLKDEIRLLSLGSMIKDFFPEPKISDSQFRVTVITQLYVCLISKIFFPSFDKDNLCHNYDIK